MNQKQLTEGNLLDENGNLIESGYSYFLIKQYHRKDIKAKKHRIKEWDYYYIGDHKYGIALTIADNSYMSLASATLFDYSNKTYIEKSKMGLFSFGKLNLPEDSSTGNISFIKDNFEFHFDHIDSSTRHLYGKIYQFSSLDTLNFDLILKQNSDKTMVIATPFDKPKHFYYNQKINCFECKGTVFCGDKLINFGNDSFGVLDWGRGVWTYKNTWYWASMSDEVDGKKVGFNLGYGFGNTNNASENMLFVNKKAYKLDDVTFNIPNRNGKEDFLSPWTMTSSKGDINLTFTPIILRKGGGNALIINSKQRQVFGVYNGTFNTEDGIVEIKNSYGFAEKVYNRW